MGIPNNSRLFYALQGLQSKEAMLLVVQNWALVKDASIFWNHEEAEIEIMNDSILITVKELKTKDDQETPLPSRRQPSL